MTRLLKKYPIILILFLSIPIFLKPSIRGNDGILNYCFLRSLIFDGDIDFQNDYAEYDKLTQYKFKLSEKPVSAKTNRIENRYGIGSSMLWMPFFFIAKFADDASGGRDLDFRGAGKIYEIAISIASSFYGIIGVFLLFLMIKKLFGEKEAYLSTAAMLFASPLFFYIYLHPSMSHANAFFLSSLAYFLLLAKDNVNAVRISLIGLVAGLLAATRLQDVFFLAPIPVVYVLIQHSQGHRTKNIIIGLLLFMVFSFIGFLPQMFVWKILYGSFISGPSAYLEYPQFKLYMPRHFIEVLFSSRHGLFFWHPILFLAFIGLFIKSERHDKIRLALLLGFLAEYYLISCWSEWHGGAAFGQRLLITSFPALIYGAAALIEKASAKVKIRHLTIIVIVFILWNFGLIFQYGKMMIPRENYISAKTIVKNQFIELPKYFLERLIGKNE